MAKRIYRLRNDKKIAGVCSGIAEYLDIDPTIVRMIWLAAVLLGGCGVVAYIIAMIVIPQQPVDYIDNQ